MAVDLDLPPLFDPLLKNKNDLMSDIWVGWLSVLLDNLVGYMSSLGFFIPNVTTEQRDEIITPQLGQLIYNTDNNELEVWQIKTGVGAWRSINTTP